jgi:hypothetical protein
MYQKSKSPKSEAGLGASFMSAFVIALLASAIVSAMAAMLGLGLAMIT